MRVHLRAIYQRARKLGGDISLLVNGAWAIPTVIVIRSIDKWLPIRVGTFNTDRIGHFTADVAGRVAENNARSNKNHVELYWLPKVTVNDYWRRITCRHLIVNRMVFYVWKWNRLIAGGEHIEKPSTTTGSRDIKGYLYRHKCGLKFTDRENRDGDAWLKDKGWMEGEPYVILMVRDKEYIRKHPIFGNQRMASNRTRVEHHSYRDSDIDLFVEAVKWLTDNGVWVIRMGQVAEKEMSFDDKRFIDYPFVSSKNAFMDIWLFANAELCISTGTGQDAVSEAWGVPMLYINYCPVEHMHSWADSINAPRPLFWKKTGKMLSFRECMGNSGLGLDFYIEKGIKVGSLDATLIRDIVKETWHMRFRGNKAKRNELFQKVFKGLSSPDLNEWINPNFGLSEEFQKRYPDFLGQ